MNANANDVRGICARCGCLLDSGMFCSDCLKPTPPATPAEMPECVRRLVDAVSPLIQQEGMAAIREAIDARDAVRDHYAKKGGQ